MNKHLVLFTLAIGGALLLSGCTAPSNGDDDAVLVEMKDTKFVPEEITIEAGQTVTWINRDSFQHDAIAVDGSFESELLNGGQTFSHTFDEPGTYEYYCSLHASETSEGWRGMVGTVIVTGGGNESA